MFEKITSIKDERIILARSLSSNKGRQAQNKILLEGEQIITWALEQNLPFDFVLSVGEISPDIQEKLISRRCPVFLVSEGIIKKVTDTNYVIPVVGVAGAPAGDGCAGNKFVVVLNDVRDAGNIGTIIRTCHAFGISDIFSTSEELDIYQRKVIDASRGSVFATRLRGFSNPAGTISYLKSCGYKIVATNPRGDSLQSLLQLKPQPVALFVGNESVSIHPDVEKEADFLVKIPMSSEMESLNVGVATGISIYEIKLKQVLAMIEQQIKASLGRELNVAGMLVQWALDAELHQVSELSSRQVIFMMVLRCDRKMTIEHMCCQFGVLEKNVSDFLEPLTHSGLIVLQGDALTLSAAGEEVLGKLWPVVERVDEKILSDFSPKEAEAFLRHLQQIQKKSVELIESAK